ncbi:hypothetical protein F53441_12490 [Fusarium austroafricanum]|uniref:Uncharacterized protein n=1 Tax=Fusarium austroafricanum TaxID=2364996 RepID=A0A8H4JWR3_9HYPO|nr:hypothetical protein F53441_12490 [Fusarium austroafricanum]
MTSISTIVADPDTAQRAVLPVEIQDLILGRLVEMRKKPEDTGIPLPSLATVSKSWRTIVERETFKHLAVTIRDLNTFSTYAKTDRIKCIKYTLLEVDYDRIDGLWPFDQVRFTSSVLQLWKILETWEDHRVTIELGVIPQLEKKIKSKAVDKNGYSLNPEDFERPFNADGTPWED